jgi:hypothetical protein
LVLVVDWHFEKLELLLFQSTAEKVKAVIGRIVSEENREKARSRRKGQSGPPTDTAQP